MDLYEIENHANNIKKYSALIVGQYKDIVAILKDLHDILSKKDLVVARKIETLIDRYNLMIKEVSDNYISSTNQILEYVENSKQNLEKLVIDIRNSAKAFSEILVNVDTTESL